MGESKLMGRTVRVAIKAAVERRTQRPMTSHAAAKAKDKATHVERHT